MESDKTLIIEAIHGCSQKEIFTGQNILQNAARRDYCKEKRNIVFDVLRALTYEENIRTRSAYAYFSKKFQF